MMSLVQLPRIESNGETGGITAPGDPVVPIIQVFDSLPDEMLLKVFSYLGHYDKLDSRLVCARWCHLITSNCGWTFIYILRHTDALKTLEKSKYCFPVIRFELDDWANIGGRTRTKPDDMSNFESLVQDLRVPDNVAENVRKLKLRSENADSYKWKTLQCLISKFSNLQALDIYADIEHGHPTGKPTRQLQDEDLTLKENWPRIVKNLKILRLFGPFGLADLAKTLSHFGGVKNLVELKVGYIFQDDFDFDDDNMEDIYEATMEHLCRMISDSLETLIKLTVSADFMDDQYLERMLTPRNLTCLKIEFRCDAQLLKRCLGSLKKLEHVCIPTFSGFEENNENKLAKLMLVAALPKTVRSLKLEGECLLESDFLDKLPELAHLKLAYSQIAPYVKTGKKYAKMRQLRCLKPETASLDWVSAFPNLTKLHLQTAWPDINCVNDLTLQTIIKNMKKLKSLKIVGSNNTISDCGVTGIRTNYHVTHLCNFLIETKTSSEDGSEEDSSEYRTGIPLCSLKWLHELEIDTQGDISDFGFLFGFGLKELRSLSLNLYDQPNRPDDNPRPLLTDTAMRFLGMENPNLEYLHLNFQCKNNVTHIGLSQLQSQLRRIKAENHNLEQFKSKL